MISVQIAELTCNLHKHVMRDIRNLIDNLSKANETTSGPVDFSADYHRGDRTQYKYLSPKTQDAIMNFAIGKSTSTSQYQFQETSYIDAKGEERPMYSLNKKACFLLASGYDVLLRAKIIDRWEELETEKMMQDLPSYQIEDPIERAKRWIKEQEATERLALENKQQAETIEQQAETIEQQAEQIKKDAPKVLFSKAVETSQRSCLVAELAKILQQNGVQIGQNRLFKWLRAKGYLGKTGPYYNQPTQRSMEKGLFEIKQQTINKPDGSIIVTSTTKVTGRGQIYFVNKFLKQEVDMAV